MATKVFKGLPLRRFKDLPESYDGDRAESLTEKIGYVPLGDRLATLLGAGKRLIAARAELYDFVDKIGPVDPDIIALRKPGFDLADLSQLKRELAKRQERSAAEKAAAKQEAQAVAQDKVVQDKSQSDKSKSDQA